MHNISLDQSYLNPPLNIPSSHNSFATNVEKIEDMYLSSFITLSQKAFNFMNKFNKK
jgi:hypothetical protein